MELPKGVSSRTSLSKLEEALGLAEAIHLDICYHQIINLHKVIPSTFLGQGHVENLKGIMQEFAIQLVFVNSSLTPVQQRNLEKVWRVKVIDRTGLILEIFGERARTAEGYLQVELAALTYQRSRLVKSWTHLERQRGGFGFTGGPGESQLELDRRLIDDRLIKIKKDLSQIKKTHRLHRKARKRIPYPIVALVGYTNAGKSTLFNWLTKADVFAKDILFATLDPTMRQVKLPSGREIIVLDTVGFISGLPTQLIAAFRATLEEVYEADLILHVINCVHPDQEAQAQDVYYILDALQLDEKIKNCRVIEVFNKIDLLSCEQKLFYLKDHQSSLVSALTGEGITELLKKIDIYLNLQRELVEVVISVTEGGFLSWCYRSGSIVHRSDKENKIYLTLRVLPQDKEKVLKYAV